MKKVLIANRGENNRVADVSANCSACAAGNDDFALPCSFGAKG
ncbi:hypothetical protein ABE501_00610 [Comamonas testosteroni]